MAIDVDKVRTETMRARLRGRSFSTDACELCCKPLRSPVAVAIDHERYEFVTDAEAMERGDAVSLFDVGQDCARRIAKALAS